MAEKTQAAAVTTTYFILEQQDDPELWQLVGSVEATSREQAARLHYGNDETEVTFSAVTRAGWQPRRRTVALKRSVKLEEVDVQVNRETPAPVAPTLPLEEDEPIAARSPEPETVA